jgi:hypothetical protein
LEFGNWNIGRTMESCPTKEHRLQSIRTHLQVSLEFGNWNIGRTMESCPTNKNRDKSVPAPKKKGRAQRPAPTKIYWATTESCPTQIKTGTRVSRLLKQKRVGTETYPYRKQIKGLREFLIAHFQSHH